jgi:hypothetical protein
MTDASLPATRFAQGDFRIGHAISRASSVFFRNFTAFFVVTAIAGLPALFFWPVGSPSSPASAASPLRGGLSIIVIVLDALSHAIVLYGAAQDMRGRPVRLADCFKVGWRRFVPIIGVVFGMAATLVLFFVVAFIPFYFARAINPLIWARAAIGVLLYIALVVILGLMLFMMWFVATPACVIERLGPFRSLRRSRELTKGHGWKLVGLSLLLLIPVAVVLGIVAVVAARMANRGIMMGLSATTTSLVARIVSLIWNATWKAFYAVLVVAVYRDLRLAKDGIDPDQLVAVFE